MVLALALSFLCAQATDGVGLETPNGWKRKEDAQQHMTVFSPPDLPKGRDCSVIVYPVIDAGIPADALVDNMVRVMSQGKRRMSELQKVDVGPFRVAVFTQQTPQGGMEYLAVHAIRWGDKGQGILFAASDPELFRSHTATVVAMLTKAVVPGAGKAAPAAGGYAGMEIPFPDGWTRQQDPSGWIVLTPPRNLSFGNPRVWIAPTRKIEGSLWAAHRELMKALIEQSKWPGSYIESPSASTGPFIRSRANCSADARTLLLFTAAAGGQMEAILLNPPGGDELLTALLPILSKTTLKNATGDAPKRPEIVEAYRRPTMKKYVNLDGTFYFGSLAYERMALLSNGVVDFNTTYAEGYDGAPGLALIDTGTLNGYYGKWSETGKTLQITRESGKAAEVWRRENGTLKFGEQSWSPLPRVDGLKLKGRYANKSKPGVGIQFNYWIDFGEDGTFKCGDLLTWLAVSDFSGRPKPPENVSGTYEIRNWTLWFKVAGKPVWSTDVQTLGDDVKDLATLLINTYSFTRE